MFSWLSKDEARNKQPEIYDRYGLHDRLVLKQICSRILIKMCQVLSYFWLHMYCSKNFLLFFKYPF
jgi:hypothetical protein